MFHIGNMGLSKLVQIGGVHLITRLWPPRAHGSVGWKRHSSTRSFRCLAVNGEVWEMNPYVYTCMELNDKELINCAWSTCIGVHNPVL
jgi:hypothetical protein